MQESSKSPDPAAAFSSSERTSLYRTIFTRRDVRSQFRPDPIPDEVLGRVLLAAHHAPSVGFMQPWNFIVIRGQAKKRQVQALFTQANDEAARQFDDDRAAQYRKLKLAGILDAPVNLCITCNHDRAGSVVLGRTHVKETDLYSTVCAVQNLWLAARAEGVGIGWVSILDTADLKAVLGLPDHVTPVAYLCVGYVTEFLDQPELQVKGWEKRLPLDELIMFEQWQGSDGDDPLLEAVREAQASLAEDYLATAPNGRDEAG